MDFDAALASFIAGCKEIHLKHAKERGYGFLLEDEFYADPNGKRYIRIVHKGGMGQHNTSVHCFVDKTNGDVLKAAGWKAPAKHARGNIYDEKNGLGRMTAYGPEYLR